MGSQNGLTAKEVAKLADEPYATVDHWTKLGVLPCQRRGRTRLYQKEAVKRCAEIRRLQNEGHSLATIRQMLGETT